MQQRLLIVLGLSILLAGCGARSGSSAPVVVQPTTVPTVPAATASPPGNGTQPVATSVPGTGAAGEAAVPVDLEALDLDLELVADGFSGPLYVTEAGDDSGRLFVVEQPGTIQIVRDGQRLAQPFLDIADRVGSSASEQGLLSVAFHPDYQRNGQFFVNYTNLDGDTVVARYRVSSDPDVADPASAEMLLTIDQPAANHNGGLVKFGPDGYLYIGMGDGGRAGDPWGNAQNRGVLLGKLLRIDVNTGTPYAIPPDNPFVDQADMQPEIWAWGLRNPWRFAFDRATGDLYIADVGQNAYEEVNFQPASSRGGENYGWNIMEGASCFGARACDTSGLVLPVVVYPLGANGCAVTGGYVYRGSALPQLDGIYFYSDYCSGKLWALRNVDGSWQTAEIMNTNINVTSFGEDAAGELYLTDGRGGGVYRLVVAGA